MQTVIDIFNFLVTNGPALISGIVGVLTAIIGVALLIPGEQPEKFLQSIVDFLTKFSKKP